MILNIAELTLWDLPDVQAGLKDIQEKAPGLSTQDAEKVLMVVMGMKLAHPELSDSLLDEKIVARFIELEKAGETWSGKYLGRLVSKIMRPAYDAAVRAGADPARSLKAQTVVLYPGKEISDEEISVLVKAFQDEDAAKK